MGKRRGGNRLKREIANLRADLMGRKLVPRADPPAFVQRPWNSWTYNTTKTGVEAGAQELVETNTIINQLIKNIGLDTTAIVELKVINAYCWCSSTGPGFASQVLQTMYYEGSVSSAGTQAVRSDQRDVGTLSRPARTGYEWPANEQRNVFIRGGTSTALVTAIALEAGSSLTVRVHCLWRASGHA